MQGSQQDQETFFESIKYLLRTLKLFAYYAVWRITRSQWLAVQLIEALADDENGELAGMLLTKGLRQTDKKVPRLLRKRLQLPNFFIVLASTENKDYIQAIEPYTHDADASVADAARIALRILSS